MIGEILKIAVLALGAISVIGIIRVYKPEFAVYGIIACSLIILYFVVGSLREAFVYLTGLYDSVNYGKTYILIVIKIMAIAYITEFSASLCEDCGEKSVASKIELAGKVVIFCISIPIFTSVITVINKLCEVF